MIDFLTVKKFMSHEKVLNITHTIIISFKRIDEFDDEDLQIIHFILTKAPKARFIFAYLRKNLIQTLLEKISIEDKKRIFFVYKGKEYCLETYEH